MHALIRLLLLAAVVFASGWHGQTTLARTAQQPPALDFKEVAEDTKLTTASGATFTVAKGWLVARSEGIVVIQEPQRELAAAFVEVSHADRRRARRGRAARRATQYRRRQPRGCRAH